MLQREISYCEICELNEDCACSICDKINNCDELECGACPHSQYMGENLKDMQPMELVQELKVLGFTRGEIAQMGHAIGMDHQKCYIRHKRKFYKPYRNYCEVEEDSADKVLWDKLVEHGYAKARLDKKNTYYLTRKGLDYLGNQLNVNIYDAEKF